ncbi:MAG: hypothetical protein LBH40_06655 [Alphaproteobacteria bacterium]|jgi:sporulation protein YlmC with PRC-barrel domain|nr:hypothetical protein [Alphaproteobacteria bacterium]
MADCIYCAQSAGFLNNKHKECEENYLSRKVVKDNIISIIKNALINNSISKDIYNETRILADSIQLFDSELTNLAILALDSAIEEMLKDKSLTEEEEKLIKDCCNFFDITNYKLMNQVNNTILIKNLQQGILPTNIECNHYFLLKKEEKLIYTLDKVKFSEPEITVSYKFTSFGFNTKNTEMDESSGKRIKTEEIKYKDTGLLAITNQNIYFDSKSKIFRIPFNNIVAVKPYNNGILIQRDEINSNHQIFEIPELDPIFLLNVISLAKGLE